MVGLGWVLAEFRLGFWLSFGWGWVGAGKTGRIWNSVCEVAGFGKERSVREGVAHSLSPLIL